MTGRRAKSDRRRAVDSVCALFTHTCVCALLFNTHMFAPPSFTYKTLTRVRPQVL